MGYRVITRHHDPDKPDLIISDLSVRLNENNLYANRFLFHIGEILSRDFNVFFFAAGNGLKRAQPLMETYPRINFVFLNERKFKFIRKRDSEDFTTINKNMVLDVIKRDLGIIKNVRGIMIKPTVLYKADMKNELHDAIANDSRIMEIAENEIRKQNERIKRGYVYTYTMYMTRVTRILMDTFDYYLDTTFPRPRVYQFILDPAYYYPYYDRLYAAKTYYFADDRRGTRNFHYFPLGALNYYYRTERIEVPEWDTKPNLLIWGGIILTPKGDRMQDWKRLLRDFRYERSVLHVAQSNAIKVVKKVRYSKWLERHPLFEETRDSVYNHPLNEGLLPNTEFEEKLKDYKYLLVLGCISTNDSLNFRIHYALLYNMLPIIDCKYDPENLQVPKGFRDRLLVYDHNDIMAKIRYFEDHPDEAKRLLREMKEYYLDERYRSEDFLYNEFKCNYFKEIYETHR